MSRVRPRLIAALLLVAAFAGANTPGDVAAIPQPGYMATFAGGGAGDGGAAFNGALRDPKSFAFGDSGELLVADGCRVRRVHGGTIDTIAGGPRCGYAGDGGPAAGAEIFPIAIDHRDGVTYVLQNCALRTITNGIIETIAGDGVCQSQPGNTPALTSRFAQASDIAVDSTGAVYIVHAECRIQKISGGMMTTVVGHANSCAFTADGMPASSALIVGAGSIAVDEQGNLYFIEVGCRVRRVDAQSGVLTSVIGTQAMCYWTGDPLPPTGGGTLGLDDLAVASDGDVYIADANYCIIRRIDAMTGAKSTFAGTGTSCIGQGDGPALGTALDHPDEVQLASNGDVYLSDECRVRRVRAGEIQTIVSGGGCGEFSGDGLPPTAATLNLPLDVSVAPDGSVLIADYGNGRVRRARDGVIETIAGCKESCAGDPAFGLNAMFTPVSVAQDSVGNVYIVDFDACMLYRLEPDGRIYDQAGSRDQCFHSGTGGAAVDATLAYPLRVEIGANDEVYVTERDEIAATFCGISRIDAGVIETAVGTGECGDSGDGGGPLSASIEPVAVAIAPNGDMFIAAGNCRIRRLHAGVIETVAGDGTCGSPGDPDYSRLDFGADLDVAANGDVLFAEMNTCRVRRVYPGPMVTVAGVPPCNTGQGDDPTPATSAKLLFPFGLAVSSDGSVYIAEVDTNRVRVVYAAADSDADGVTDSGDNCPSIANADQANADADRIDLSPMRVYDDITRANSDAAGDACDDDDDNDGLSDQDETTGAACDGVVSDTVNSDTDGDRALDGAECGLGTDPANVAASPSPVQCGPANDADGDGILAFRETCYFGTDPAVADADGDGCSDGHEAASVNADRAVNVLDLQQVAVATTVLYAVQFDLTKDGSINVLDLQQTAGSFGVCS